jgi:hypothetical protein
VTMMMRIAMEGINLDDIDAETVDEDMLDM